MSGKVLVAGIGNIFLGDDGFGVEVAQRLASREVPANVKVVDFGIRGMHLAYELLDGGYDTVIMVDASPQGDTPGTVYLIEPDLSSPAFEGAAGDAHSMSPGSVFAMLKSLGGVPCKVLIVGCEPFDVEERMGLSEPVEAAVDEAIDMIFDVLGREELVGARPGGGDGDLNKRSV